MRMERSAEVDQARPDGLVCGPHDGRTVEAPAGRVTFKARGAETGGAITFCQTLAAPGQGPPLHVHLSADEFLYVVSGRLRVQLADALHHATAGSFVFVPRGIAHTWQVAGDVDARFVFGFTPASPEMERFFERAAELSSETRLEDAFGRFSADAGMEVLGPPLAHSHPAPSAA
jgi:quercetin dioxygenase-like cupin family protein